MEPKTRRHLLMLLTTVIVVTCMGVMIHFSGFDHESMTAKNILLAVVIVLFFQMTIADPIKFVIIALEMSLWPHAMAKYPLYRKEDDNMNNYNRLDFLKLRLRSMKSKMRITERYRNEQLNLEFRNIVHDLYLYGSYFLVLTGVVLVSRNELTYYNTATMNDLFMFNRSIYVGLNEVYHLNQLFDFIQSSLVEAFKRGDAAVGISKWTHISQARLLGVVRLRQLRLAKEQFGYGSPEYTEQPYKPDWQLPYQQYHYADKYWRVYDPWVPMVPTEFLEKLVLNFNHHGQVHDYPELKGYVALLGRAQQNTQKVLEFLSDYNWLTYNTSAVFMDFTLYNIDADMFSVCTLWVEQTPFGGIIPNICCDSIQLIVNTLEISYTRLLILLVYLITFLEFIQAFIVNIWYEPSKLRSIWFKMDAFIIVVNIILIAVILWRASIVASMLKRLEGANKLEFLDFRIPGRLYFLCNMLTGFLISATTLRLWKVLQFARVFQIFTRTLFSAWMPLLITCSTTVIFLGAFGIATCVINGNNNSYFMHAFTSVVSILCFSFGFKSEIRPEDLFHGGKYLGVILYATMGFVIAVLLMNVFSSLMNTYFIEAKTLGDAKFKEQITFFQFLRVEFDNAFRILGRMLCMEKFYKRNGRTVAENVQIMLDKRERENTNPPAEKDEHLLQVEYRERIELTLSISSVLKIQMEILENLLFAEIEEQKKKHKKHKPKDKEPNSPYDSMV
ncbi:hypothetical protein AWZ03_008298 [Drosophila navojoa]|uniref:Uncharacterized protein n=1 Tax=Drosophila navojoa TaxID=7232 RepID=A0A484B8Q3_DRONA|nr:polycystin-2-like [Drosophila navojoa]TDG45236.1 hypothetical protein AWZ03_008298 [Drosophila navojoa]